MKFHGILNIFFLLLFNSVAYSQFVYKIKTDSLLVTNDSCNAEFNLENRSRNVNGFLYNRGNGRTEFRKAVLPLGYGAYQVGNDTLQFRNGIGTQGNTIEWGSDTLNYSNMPPALYRPTVLNQNGYSFQWVTGWHQQIHITNNPYRPFNSDLYLGNYIPLRVSHDLQGFIYLENNYSPNGSANWNSPMFGILWGNRDSNAQKYSYFGQKITGNLTLTSFANGTGATKDVPGFIFGLAGDTLSGPTATILGTGTSKYGIHKLPTLIANYRFSIGGESIPYGEGTGYPYTRFYANAYNQPFVWKNLPWNTQPQIDTVLSIDYDGNVRQRQLPQVLSVVATLDFPSTSSANSSDLTLTVIGAIDGDVVSLGVPNVSINPNSCYTAWVSASNTVTIRFNNYGSSTIDPSSGIFKIKVFK